MATSAAGALGLLWGWLWSEPYWRLQNVVWMDLEGVSSPRGCSSRDVLLNPVYSVLASRTMDLIRPNPTPSLKRCSYLLPSIPTSRGWRAPQSNQTGMSEIIQCWFGHPGNQDKLPTLTKFCESL
uniref:Uncharacterized protein n=1 Tax=Oryctolagus cuniculus TaxID=9986 RepID=A0A5F9C6W6_RABIT